MQNCCRFESKHLEVAISHKNSQQQTQFFSLDATVIFLTGHSKQPCDLGHICILNIGQMSTSINRQIHKVMKGGKPLILHTQSQRGHIQQDHNLVSKATVEQSAQYQIIILLTLKNAELKKLFEAVYVLTTLYCREAISTNSYTEN